MERRKKKRGGNSQGEYGRAVILPDLKKGAFRPSVALRPQMASTSLTNFCPPEAQDFCRFHSGTAGGSVSPTRAGEPPLPAVFSAPRPPPGHAAAFASSGYGSPSLSRLQHASEPEAQTWICLPGRLRGFTCPGVAGADAGGTHACFSPASPLRKPPAGDVITRHPCFSPSSTAITCLASR